MAALALFWLPEKPVLTQRKTPEQYLSLKTQSAAGAYVCRKHTICHAFAM
jgi:hypothetical protein